jgi:hypothetical protein
VVYHYWLPSGKAGLTVLDPGLIYPYDWNRGDGDIRKYCRASYGDTSTFDREKCKGLLPHAFAVTYWRHSWEEQRWWGFG